MSPSLKTRCIQSISPPRRVVHLHIQWSVALSKTSGLFEWHITVPSLQEPGTSLLPQPLLIILPVIMQEADYQPSKLYIQPSFLIAHTSSIYEHSCYTQFFQFLEITMSQFFEQLQYLYSKNRTAKELIPLLFHDSLMPLRGAATMGQGQSR